MLACAETSIGIRHHEQQQQRLNRNFIAGKIAMKGRVGDLHWEGREGGFVGIKLGAIYLLAGVGAVEYLI